MGSNIFGIGHCSFIIISPYEALAKVYFTPHPCPLPQGERVYYQAPPLMGGVGEGEYLILLQEPPYILIENK
jgi:hypothetical protein